MPSLPQGAATPDDPQGYRTVWRLVNGQPQGVKIKTGDTTGNQIEVLESQDNALQAGDALIVGVEVPL
ncbi:hypothetical protein [Thiomicrorhabdus aquaedulcis]|uniref:hypothetical protein n=1 Tax=Thiomicrorhabdus aquaedulcis TaxID=2211106 RepID=UPI000FDA847A|nr:hypothetical protein [Thiomicrorhabdus aquaedulcis]